RVLVTGASGFVGRHCLPLLAKADCDVLAVSRTRVVDAADVTWVHADLLSDDVEHLVDDLRPTHLLHLAWCTSPGNFWHTSENVLWRRASRRLYRRFVDAGGQRIVATGSCAEYEWSGNALDEDATPLAADTLYGQTKVRSALDLDAAVDGKTTNAAWARLFFMYGPFASEQRMPGVVISSLLSGKMAQCSSGTQRCDFVYIKDVASALVSLLLSNVSGAFNICSGLPVSVREIAEFAAALVGRSDLVRFGAVKTGLEPQAIFGNNERVQRELDWRPAYSLERGLQETIDWYREKQIGHAA
ncbi:MAG: NAD(P)-dependent oxidoreductase, partial [Fuerstiella sp.]|nr:NAD(P)-dependent oxidoreductase [Fuerstiella sp.]